MTAGDPVTGEVRGTVALIGPGRAGRAVTAALGRAGHRLTAAVGRGDPLTVVASAETVVIATPDDSVAGVARALAGHAGPGSLVVHLSGASGLDVFDALRDARPDVRLGSLHPLQSLTGGPADVDRLTGSWFAVAGPPEVADLARDCGGHPFTVTDRALYHAAACVASNHLVALLGQVERLAGAAGVPAEAFWPLVAGSFANVQAVGACSALTGPVARGDVATVARHLQALPVDELDAYRALARAALRLTGRVDAELEELLS